MQKGERTKRRMRKRKRGGKKERKRLKGENGTERGRE